MLLFALGAGGMSADRCGAAARGVARPLLVGLGWMGRGVCSERPQFLGDLGCRFGLELHVTRRLRTVALYGSRHLRGKSGVGNVTMPEVSYILYHWNFQALFYSETRNMAKMIQYRRCTLQIFHYSSISDPFPKYLE